MFAASTEKGRLEQCSARSPARENHQSRGALLAAAIELSGSKPEPWTPSLNNGEEDL